MARIQAVASSRVELERAHDNLHGVPILRSDDVDHLVLEAEAEPPDDHDTQGDAQYELEQRSPAPWRQPERVNPINAMAATTDTTTKRLNRATRSCTCRRLLASKTSNCPKSSGTSRPSASRSSSPPPRAPRRR